MLGFDPEDIMTINYAKVCVVEHNVKVHDNVGGDKAVALQNVVVRMTWYSIFASLMDATPTPFNSLDNSLNRTPTSPLRASSFIAFCRAASLCVLEVLLFESCSVTLFQAPFPQL